MGLRVTWSRALDDADARDFDAFVEADRSASYAQERSYAELACAGRAFRPRFFLVRDGDRVVGTALVLRAVGPLGAPMPAAIVERGPVCALPDLERVVRALHHKTRSRGILRLSVMPWRAGEEAREVEQILASCNFRVDHDFSSAHARTLRLSLAGKSKDDLFAGKDGKTVRQEVKNSVKAGAVTTRGSREDVRELAKLHGEMMAGQGHGGKSGRFYAALADRIANAPERAAIFTTRVDGAVVSIAYVARHGATTTYVMGASSQEERPFTKAAPCVAAAIEWAREMGCDTFDLGGIPLEGDDDPKRRSIAAFKYKFSKNEVALARNCTRWL